MARIWEAFLTERDKAHLAIVGERPRIGFGQRPALVLIDNYRGVLGDYPAPILEHMKKWPSSTGEEGWEAIEYTQRLLDLAREVGIPVVHVTGNTEPIVPWARGSRGYGRRKAGTPEERARMARNTEFPDELAPVEGEPVIRKSSPSAFWGTPLAGLLIALGVDTVIACGESTSGCLRASVVDGTTNRFRMIVPEETAYDRHQATHAINLFDMNQKYADVLPTADVLDYLRTLKADAAPSE
jgi:maleamate amidohydrolase